MKRTLTSISDRQRQAPAATGAAATHATVIVESTQIDKDPFAGAKSPAPTRSHGKRKRSRSQMITTTARLNLQEDPDTSATKRMKATMSTTGRPSLGDQGVFSGNSDEDEDLVSLWSAPPPPPSEPVPPELVCKYPNKPCPHRRANKKHGELHSYCAFHRYKAQQYQRTLEKKKRKQKLLEEEKKMKDAMLRSGELPASAYRQSPASATTSPQGRVGRGQKSSRNRSSSASAVLERSAYPTSVVRSREPPLEPFHHPVRLHEGDIHLLQVLLLDSNNSPPKAGEPGVGHTQGAVWNPRLPQLVPPSGTTLTAQPGMQSNSIPSAVQRRDGSYALNLEGFTFTSESL